MGRHVAQLAGLDLAQAPATRVGVGGDVLEGHVAEVGLEITHGGTSHRWEAPVWFCDPWRPSFGLLGLTGFFDHFVVTIAAYEEWFSLEPAAA